MKNPLISVLMPVFNSETRLIDFTHRILLKDAIETILNQTFQDFELIILDNMSRDQTYEICLAYGEEDSRIRVYKDNELTNTEEALGKLLKFASGQLIAFANDDDKWDPYFLETVVRAYEFDRSADCYFTNAVLIDLNDKPIREMTKQTNENVYDTSASAIEKFTRYFLARDPLPKIFGLYKCSSLERVLPLKKFDSLGADMDNLFFMKFFSQNMSCRFIDLPLFFYRDRPRPIGEYKNLKISDEIKASREVLKYLNHQLDFYLESCLIARLTFKASELNFFFAFSFEGFLSHTIAKLEWLKTDYVNQNRVGRSVKQLISFLNSISTKLDCSFNDFVFSPNQNETSQLVFCDDVITRRQKTLVKSALIQVHDAFARTYQELGIENRECRFDELISLMNSPHEGIESVELREEFNEPVDRNLLISILVTSKNLEHFVSDTLSSIEKQKKIELEILVADGGSLDKSVQLISRFPHARLVSLKDKGFVDGLNLALNESDSPYVAQCCISDGYINENWLFEATDYLRKNPNVSLVWGFPQYMTEDGVLGKISYEQYLHKETPILSEMYFQWLSNGFYFPEGNFVCRRDVFRRCLITQNEFERNPVEAFLEFTARFHEIGYLSSHIPTVANFGRYHQGQSGAILTDSGAMKSFHKRYRLRMRRERRRFLLTRKKSFLNPDGKEIQVLTISPSIVLKIYFQGIARAITRSFEYLKALIPKNLKTSIRSGIFQLKSFIDKIRT